MLRHRIVEWAEDYVGGVPLVLKLLGDGQSVLRLRDLKRLFPHMYKHVLVTNGPFHSAAHFSFSVLYLWDKPLLSRCWILLGKEDVLGPNIKNLEHNSAEHARQGVFAVVAAIWMYLFVHVKSPSPALLRRSPTLYLSHVQNAGGIVLLQFLRHAGCPVMFWQRSARAMDGVMLDKLHALAFHTVCVPVCMKLLIPCSHVPTEPSLTMHVMCSCVFAVAVSMRPQNVIDADLVAPFAQCLCYTS